MYFLFCLILIFFPVLDDKSQFKREISHVPISSRCFASMIRLYIQQLLFNVLIQYYSKINNIHSIDIVMLSLFTDGTQRNECDSRTERYSYVNCPASKSDGS